MIAQGTKEELVAQSFGSRSDVLMRFASSVENAAAWAAARGGTLQEAGRRAFRRGRSLPISRRCWTPPARDGLEVIDVVLRRPNLESVFLQLTGRDLRQ